MTYSDSWKYLYAVQRGLKHRKADKQISINARKYYKNIDQLENMKEKGFGRASPLTFIPSQNCYNSK